MFAFILYNNYIGDLWCILSLSHSLDMVPFTVDCHQMANMLNPPSTTATVPVTKVDA